MGDLSHHIIHFLMYSLVIWQIVLGVYIILLWAKRNIKFEKTSPVINVSETKGFDYPIEVLKDRLDGKKVGSFGLFGCFSFYANKTITSGEGGIITTNSKKYYEKSG